MKIFVIGQSGCGKTPFAKLLAPKLGMQYVSATEWVTSHIPESCRTKQDTIDATNRIMTVELLKNPSACVDYLKANYDLTQPTIVEGVRNPADFFQLLDPMADVVVFLNREENPHKASLFDRGIVVISDYIHWLVANGLYDKERRVNFMYKIDEMQETVDNFHSLFTYIGWCNVCGSVKCEHQREALTGKTEVGSN